MSERRAVNLGMPELLEFHGPDAVRFLNGQLTQDVRRVVGNGTSLPSCVTDAKGKLQYRINLTESKKASLWVECPQSQADGLETRLTRYLIADDVEVTNLTGEFILWHVIGANGEIPGGVFVRKSSRYGVPGEDWWISARSETRLPDGLVFLTDDELEVLRIFNGIPAWGLELTQGMLPPEALLDTTDISYNKGCYIGQEVISRIKSAGKVNRYLTRFEFDGNIPVIPGPLENGAGEITSVSPLLENGVRRALGYIKRGAENWIYRTADGSLVNVRASLVKSSLP